MAKKTSLSHDCQELGMITSSFVEIYWAPLFHSADLAAISEYFPVLSLPKFPYNNGSGIIIINKIRANMYIAYALDSLFLLYLFQLSLLSVPWCIH